MNPIRFYTRVDVTLSDKPLEVIIIAVAVAIVYYYIKDKQLSRRETK